MSELICNGTLDEAIAEEIDKCQVGAVVSLAALEAAVRWMELYGKPIEDDDEYRKMMEDDNICENYKSDISLIRSELKRARQG